MVVMVRPEKKTETDHENGLVRLTVRRPTMRRRLRNETGRSSAVLLRGTCLDVQGRPTNKTPEIGEFLQ